MSYTFTVQERTKAEAIEVVAANLDKVCDEQPDYATNRQLTQNTAQGLVNTLLDDEAQDVHVSVSGWIWRTDGGIAGVGATVSAQLTARGDGTA